MKKKYKGTPIIHDYWFDYDSLFVYAIVEWSKEKTTKNKSNLILHMREYNDNSKKI